MESSPGSYDFRASIWDCHVDYLTATSRGSIPYGLAASLNAVSASIAARWSPLEEPRPMNLLGYAGRGVSVIFKGARADGEMIRVSGPAAHEAARHIPSSTFSCSRIDLAVDVWVGFDPDVLIRAAFEKAIEWRDASARGFRRKVRIVDTAGDGNTLYVGARTSQVFFRMYNKGKESEEPRYDNCVRFEVQYNGMAAREVHIGCEKAQYNVSALCQTILKTMGKVGLDVVVGYQDRDAIGWSVTPPTPDETKQIQWLREQVSPTAKRVAAKYGLNTLLSILGVGDDD